MRNLDELDWTIDTLRGAAPVTADRVLPKWALRGWDRGGNVLAPPVVLETDPFDPMVGWGLILPDRPGLADNQPDTAEDAPEPIQQLLEHMSGKVLRYRRDTALQGAFLHDYAAGRDLYYAAGSATGVGPGQIPRYLLIVGTPQQIPWSVQGELNGSYYVGRLDLDEQGLANYVAHRLTNWADSAARYDAPVVWSAVVGGGDITALMRDAIAEKLVAYLRSDGEMAALSYLGAAAAAPALAADLAATLRAQTPALVVTTSHGVTEPHNTVPLPARLGLPVDANLDPIDLAGLLRGWQPDGAVWFAQACCSAGANSPSSYQQLFPKGSAVRKALCDAGSAGALTAPLPKALLGAAKPLRAFIGRVEPTFRWTMQDPWTGAPLTEDLVRALYLGICGRQPVGYALNRCYRPIGGLMTQASRLAIDYETTRDPLAAKQVRSLSVYDRVVACDRENLMLLGDPAVALVHS